MMFRDFIVRDAIISDMAADNPRAAIAEMLDACVASHVFGAEAREGVLAGVIEREKLCSTAIGFESAVPHAKHPAVHRLAGLVARSRAGVPFSAPDGKPVRLFFLVLSSQAQTARHLEALAHISNCLRQDLFRQFLLTARDAGEIADLLNDFDMRMQ